MKNPLILILLGVVTLTSQGQNASVVSAYNYLQDGDYATMAKEKTWRYRGDIYRVIALGDDATLKSAYPEAMDRAIESYLKATELDTKGANKDDNMRALGALQAASLNAGNDAFAAKDYDGAVRLYGNSKRIAAAFGQVDSLAAFNSALAQETKGDHAAAVASYRECINMGYKKVDIYRFMASQQKKMGDLDAAITSIREGRMQFPASKTLVQDELAFLLETGRDAEAETIVKVAIEQDPKNPLFYSVLGSLYDAKANPKSGETPPQAEVMGYYDQAEQAYRKAIENDPNFFDAIFNIGVLYNNRAAIAYEEASAIKDNAKYAVAKAKADEIYLKAMPFFEKAHELRPDDLQTIQQLTKLYAKTNDKAKYDPMRAKLEALTGTK